VGVWVKICGVTRVDDARAAWHAGADAVGLNFVGGPRQLSIRAATPILEQRPADRTAVALVEWGPSGIEPVLKKTLSAAGVRHLQLYGQITSEVVATSVAEGWLPLIVCRSSTADFSTELARWAGSSSNSGVFGVVLDAHDPNVQGGTGRTLDWKQVAHSLAGFAPRSAPNVILAGGLNPRNIRRAIEVVKPWGVDVSSGVERSPGLKDAEVVAAFIQAARSAS
jgi:phosphoribosylanthranilate isomerase